MEFKGQVESAIRMTRARMGLIGDGACLKTIWVVRLRGANRHHGAPDIAHDVMGLGRC